MRAKDIKVGEYYGHRMSYGTRLQRVKVLSVGEKKIEYQKKNGVEVQFDSGHITVVSGYYIVRPWAEYAAEEKAKEDRIARQAAHYKARESKLARLQHCLEIAGLGHASTHQYPDYVDVRLATADQMEILSHALELAAATVRPVDLLDKASPNVGRDEIDICGANLHMAMRKFMESDTSSMLYNAISACPDEVWEKILRAWSKIEGDTLRERFAMIDWYGIGLAFDSNAHLVRMGFEKLDQIEWAILEKMEKS